MQAFTAWEMFVELAFWVWLLLDVLGETDSKQRFYD